MDQQQEQQKKKRPYHNNRRRPNNRPAGQEGGKNPAVQENAQNANAPAQGAPANNGGNRQPSERTQGERPQNERKGDGRGNNRGRGGNDIHTRRGGFRPAPDAPGEEGKQPTVTEGNREVTHGAADKREGGNRENNRDNNRENNRDNNRGGRQRGGKGRDGNRPKDGAPREGAPRDGGKNGGRADNRGENRDGRGENRAENRDNRTPEVRTDGHGNDRGRHGGEGSREGGRNRPRRGENRAPLPEVTPKRETVQAPRDPEMDAWFAAPTEAKFSESSSPVAEAETVINVELNLNDILPPIVLEKYEDKKQETAKEAEVTEEAPEEPVATVEVIGVRFNKAGKVYYFAPNGNVARKGDAIIVETARGLEFGEAWQPNHEVPESEIVPPLRPVVRLADERDIAHNADNRRREDDAFRICLDKIKAHGLDMKLVEAQYTFDNSKLLFYFTSAGRVDFRELVKDLASVFRTRIELRQIGIRDEAKLMGGLGICGRPLCCASFLSDFSQVSIKMAKEQNLSLNSAKISGTCGRLMCCLNYEYPVYCEAARHTPPLGSTVSTPDGVGTVVETNPLGGTVKVSLANAQSGTVPQYYRREDVKVLNTSRQHASEAQDEDESDEISE